MKQGWEYKKLEEVGNINYGTRVVHKKNKGSSYYVYGGGGATFMVDSYNREDCFIVSRFAMSPKCTRFVKGKFFLNDSGLSVSTKTTYLTQSFLDQVLLANNDIIYSMGKGLAQRNLDISSFRHLLIPIPPIGEQKAICSELDKLSLVIEKKKEQLKELDNLAQSIFYDMFGDHVTNEKGWDVKPLGEVGELQRGGGFLKSDFVDNGVPCIHYGQIHMKFGRFITNHLTEISKSVAEKSKIAHKGDVILAITSEDVEGSCKCTAWMGDYDVYVGAHAAIFKHNLNPIYVSYYIMSSGFQSDKVRYVHGIKVMEIKPSDICKIGILLPPLTLQQSFAEKIEAIEHQKELINQSIQEVQTLFDSRMDYYFGD